MTLYVISVGGSLIVPGAIDLDFLKKFKAFILKRIKTGDRFILISGGGRTARNYQLAAEAVSKIDDEEKDWLGIHSTRLNGHLLRTIFKEQANPQIIMNYIDDLQTVDFTESVLVGAGWKPGWSTDYDAVLMAEKYGAKTVINLSNVSQVCAEDPRINPLAEKFSHMTWKQFQGLVGDKWDPGMSAPFDPIASKKATELKLEVAIMSGSDLDNVADFMDEKLFLGTLIKD